MTDHQQGDMPAGYPCASETSNLPIIALPPQTAESTSSSKTSHIKVGAGTLIPRWKVPSGGLKLRWYTAVPSFKNADDATYATQQFAKAAAEWSKIGFGVTFEQTTDEATAHFRLCHGDSKNPRTKSWDDNEEVRAKAPLPHEQARQDIWVLPRTFESKRKPTMYNDFLHELGHALGLRHEFSGWRDFFEQLGSVSVSVGKPNEKSVMTYSDPPMMQSTDIEGVKQFYGMAEGTMIEGIKIVDFPPVLRTKGGPNLGND